MIEKVSMTELLPCPFCGVKPTIKETGNIGFFMCRGKPCRGSGMWSVFTVEDKQKAIDAWNTRVYTNTISAQIKNHMKGIYNEILAYFKTRT